MRTRGAPVLLALLVPVVTYAAEPVETTICEALAHPVAFDGKSVRLRGTVVLRTENFSIVQPCSGSEGPDEIWLEYGYPEEAPTPFCCPGGFDRNNKPIFSEPRVNLVRDGSFKKLKRDLAARRSGKDDHGDDCSLFRPPSPECQKFTVSATLTGKLSAVKLVAGMGGFGHFGLFPAKLVIQRVEDVTSVEVKLHDRPAP